MIKCDKGIVTIEGKVSTLLKECICIIYAISKELNVSYEALIEMAKGAEKALEKDKGKDNEN